MEIQNLFFGLAILVPMLVYLLAAFKLERPSDYKAFLYPSNRISAAKFANSSTAYNLQVAAFSFFFYLGFASPIAAIINIAFWSAGIFFFRRYIGNVKEFFGKEISLNALIGQCYGSNLIRKIAGIAVFLAFTSLLLAELLFGSLVLLSLGIDEAGRILVTFAFAAFVLLYFQRGGKLSVLHTDEHQLVFSYLGIFAVLSWALAFGSIFNPDARGSISVLCLATFLLLLFSWHVQNKQKFTDSSKQTIADRAISILLVLMIILAFSFFLLNAVSFKPPTALIEIALHGIPEFGLWSYMSAFLVTPLFWQFGDATNWHRLGAVTVHADQDAKQDLGIVKLGLTRYAIQSPVSIAVIALLGAAAQYSLQSFSSEDAYNVIFALPAHLFAEPATFIFGLLFVVAIIGIMLSTTDSYLSSAVFVFTYDIWKPSRDLIAEDEIEAGINRIDTTQSSKIIKIARSIAALTMIGGLAAYTLLVSFKIDILSYLFFGFSIPLSFVPSVLGMLLFANPRQHQLAAETSIVVGLLAAVSSFAYAQFDSSWSYLPPLVTLAASAAVLVIMTFLNRLRGE